MNLNHISKLNLVALLSICLLSPAFGMSQGAGPSAAQTTVTIRRNPDYVLNARSFILLSNDFGAIGVPENVITDTFNGKPLSPVLTALFSSGTREEEQRKAYADFPAVVIRQFIELLIATHILAGTGIDLHNQEIIEAFSKQLPMLTNNDTTHYLELIQMADYYQISFLVQEIGYYVAHSSAVIEDFILHAKDYKDAFTAIPYTIPVTIGTGNWLLQTTLRGHDGIVFSVAFSPDSQRIVSGSQDHTIKIWHKNPDNTFNPEPQTLREHDGTVCSVAFSPDGQQIVSGSHDNTIKIWHKNLNGSFNLESQTLHGHTEWVNSVAFSPDGQHIVSGSQDHTIKIWHKNPDSTFNPKPQTLRGHTGPVSSVTFSLDGQQIVSGSLDSTIKIWYKNLNGTFNPKPQALHGANFVNSVACSPDSQQVIRGSFDRTIKIWHKNLNGTFNLEPQTLLGHDSMVFEVSFSPDGQKIVSGSHDNTIKIWQKDLVTIQCSLLQALLIGAITHAPGMILYLREETEANRVLREIALSCIGTPAEAFVREHVIMDWASHAGSSGAGSSTGETGQGGGAGATADQTPTQGCINGKKN